MICHVLVCACYVYSMYDSCYPCVYLQPFSPVVKKNSRSKNHGNSIQFPCFLHLRSPRPRYLRYVLPKQKRRRYLRSVRNVGRSTFSMPKVQKHCRFRVLVLPLRLGSADIVYICIYICDVYIYIYVYTLYNNEI